MFDDSDIENFLTVLEVKTDEPSIEERHLQTSMMLGVIEDHIARDRHRLIIKYWLEYKKYN